MAQLQSVAHVLKPVNVNANESGQSEIEFGQDAFATTSLTKEVRTGLTEVNAAMVLPIDPTYATNTSADQVYCDGTVTSNAVTVSRAVSGKSGMKFWYIFIGKRYATT